MGPGILRRRSGLGFIYVGPEGNPVKEEETLRRICRPAIPSAWQEVWICPWAIVISRRWGLMRPAGASIDTTTIGVKSAMTRSSPECSTSLQNYRRCELSSEIFCRGREFWASPSVFSTLDCSGREVKSTPKSTKPLGSKRSRSAMYRFAGRVHILITEQRAANCDASKSLTQWQSSSPPS